MSEAARPLEDDGVRRCPRCLKRSYVSYPGKNEPRRDRGLVSQFGYPVVSRVADIYICTTCGTEEAQRSLRNRPQATKNEWPV